MVMMMMMMTTLNEMVTVVYLSDEASAVFLALRA